MALHRMPLRLRQTVTHVRWLHTSGLGQQQEALVVEPEPEPFSVFRTQQNDPASQSEKHIGQFYTIPPADIRTLFPHGLPRRYQQQVKTFTEAAVMVRQPALEVISYLKETDMSKPAQRYMFYGLKGGGKTLSLCHAVHFCYTQGWLVLHIPDAHSWVKNCKELLPSSFNASRFDQPLQATEWLRNFKITNESFLSKIKTRQRYVWTKRELTEEGSPLGELVDQGINRVKSSSDVVGALMKELRQQSGQPGCDFHLAVAVDGVNALWGKSSIQKEDKSEVDPDELTLVYNLRKMMRNDWTGGAIITTLSHTGAVYPPKLAYLPQELLGELKAEAPCRLVQAIFRPSGEKFLFSDITRGFDKMDPFIPVSVPYYSEKEFESCYLYYMDRNWLQHPMSRTEEGKKEIIFMTDRNPSLLDRICAFL